MTKIPNHKPAPILLLVAGAKGAIGSTLAVAISVLGRVPQQILPYLTTANKFPQLGSPKEFRMVGWDVSRKSLANSIIDHGVLPEKIWSSFKHDLNRMNILNPPLRPKDLKSHIRRLITNIKEFQSLYPDSRPVFINLLPAAVSKDLSSSQSFDHLLSNQESITIPDLAYTIAAINCGLPVVNFTSNEVEIPIILREAVKKGVPICGRDGKTGQTYLKVVLASALKARNLIVDGWYSLNLLGNSDGKNLLEPGHAEGKLKNKTNLLDDILGYHPGEKYGISSHKVSIDYYAPRGDAKEAWDVIDFSGLFDLPMGLRINLQGRDSILAAPLVLDLARWITALHQTGRTGPVPELGFFFKKPVGKNPPLTFQEQLKSLAELEGSCQDLPAPHRTSRQTIFRKKPIDRSKKKK